MVAGELVFAVGHKGDLPGAARKLADEVHQVLRGLPSMLYSRPARPSSAPPARARRGTDVALVGARMHRDALRARLQAQLGRARDAGNAQVARVAHQATLLTLTDKAVRNGKVRGAVQTVVIVASS
jgi:hypothetical protein